ncbi:MAG: electron transfer flavoprotein subunit alpha/FixB family protein [Desulfurococcales archaeon]|nr:electron transfer flavoprotein subunit alpha/FixB family protein [Desulfurococcales archaeon]
MKILVFAINEKDIPEAIGAASTLGGEVYVAGAGSAINILPEVSKGAKKAFSIKTDKPEPLAKAFEKVYDKVNPDLVITITAKNIRDAISRLAAKKNIPFVVDALTFSVEEAKITIERGILSGRAVAKISLPLPSIVSLPPRKFKPATLGDQAVEIEDVAVEEEGKVKVIERKPKEKGGVNLEEAEVIVSAGRGFRSKEDLKLAFELADLLGAQIGCSRPVAADLQWLSEEHWVGLSGKKVAPKVYFAIGISGAPQHLAGIIDAKIVVAINKDKSAPIFKNADYGVVADLYQFLPVLMERIKAKKSA